MPTHAENTPLRRSLREPLVQFLKAKLDAGELAGPKAGLARRVIESPLLQGAACARLALLVLRHGGMAANEAASVSPQDVLDWLKEHWVQVLQVLVLILQLAPKFGDASGDS